MITPRNDLLLLAGKVLALIMQGALLLAALALTVATAAIVFFGADFLRGAAVGTVPVVTLAGLLLLLLAAIGALFLFFGKLRAIIDTVGEGDPFAPANAERLNLMAWLLLGAQVLAWPAGILTLVVAEWADELDNVDVSLEFDGLDLTGALMVLVLFILARVFRHGAAMRDDLEGTV